MSDISEQNIRVAIFVIASLLNLIYSWRPLHNPRVHGFYRFFIFEGILILLVINGAMGPTASPRWLKDFSQFINVLAVVSVATGYYQLRRAGGHSERASLPTNHHFENTEHLVTSGIYRYIRHPMYCSLLLFAWGIFLGYPTWAGAPALITAVIGAYIAARVEELENIAYFGNEYREYMKTTKMFIPFIG